MESRRLIVNLTASRFYGGPERQMLGLAHCMNDGADIVFASYSEGGLCSDFLDRARREGFRAHRLAYDTPRIVSAVREFYKLIRKWNPSVVLTHGCKANLVGRIATAGTSTSVIGVSRGWTRENKREHIYEQIDRRVLRSLDRVVCVSQAQAHKVRGAGVPSERVLVIRNAVQLDRFASEQPQRRREMESFFSFRPALIVGTAGRLSPEKGHAVLIDAVRRVVHQVPDVGFVAFGDGPLRKELERKVQRYGLERHFVFCGFRSDLDQFVPHVDLSVLPSFTEGLPNVVLESFAAGVPVVATAVGGTPEVVDDGRSGFLVPSGNASVLADRIVALLRDSSLRHTMGEYGRDRVRKDFSFRSQSEAYLRLFDELQPRIKQTRKGYKVADDSRWPESATRMPLPGGD